MIIGLLRVMKRLQDFFDIRASVRFGIMLKPFITDRRSIVKKGRGPATLNEAELISKIKTGHQESFNELVNLYAPVIERFAYQMGNNPQDIDDITQEVLIRVYRSLDRYTEGKFSTWLYKITLNISRDHYRKQKSAFKKFKKARAEAATDELSFHQDTLLQKEEDRVLHSHIQKLDDKYKIPIILFYFHDKKIEEIAEIMRTPVSTVKTRLARAKRKLKSALEMEENHENR